MSLNDPDVVQKSYSNLHTGSLSSFSLLSESKNVTDKMCSVTKYISATCNNICKLSLGKFTAVLLPVQKAKTFSHFSDHLPIAEELFE